VELEFWPLDVTYGVVGDVPEVRIFAVTSSGERVTIVDRSFRPYFYVIGEVDVKHVAKLRGVLMAELVDRKFYGRPVKAIKVVARIPEDVRRLREEVKSIPGVKDVLEADIRFYMRYMIDRGLWPSTWHVAEVEELNVRMGSFDGVYAIRGDPKPVPEKSGKLPSLRLLAFDIEVYNPRGTPNAQRDPIIVISVATDRGAVEQFTASGKDDRGLIREFVDYVRSYDPDVIFGYNSNEFDWPYLVKRASKLGIGLPLSRLGGSPEQSVYGHWSILGRANVDLYNFVEEIQEIKVKTLDRVAEYFGIMKREEMVLIPGHRVWEYWDDEEKRGLLLKYAEQDVRSTYELGVKLLPYAVQLSSVTGIPLDQVGAASVGARVDWTLLRYAFRMGELAPNREERAYESYKGAIVLEPKPGIHENIAVLDFSSMYPTIIMKYNISPDTYVEFEEGVDCWLAPEVGHCFRKSPTGFFPAVVRDLVSLRKKVREQMKGLAPNDIEYILLNERQRALKILANAIYGYSGWVGARWYKREVAEAITAFARKAMKSIIDYARKIGGVVIYGDTDSLFIKYDEDVARKLIEWAERELEMDIKLEKVYVKVLFTEAKKRYAGLLPDNRIDIVGFEVVRGDWCELAKEAQLKVIEMILTSKNSEEARRRIVEYARDLVRRLKSYDFDIDDLIIWKTLDKELDEYKVITPHLHAARMMIKSGFKVSKGDTIGYVIVKGGEKVTYRTKPYFMARKEEVDVDYYVDRQIVPAILRVAEVVGVRRGDLMGGGGKTLVDWLR